MKKLFSVNNLMFASLILVLIVWLILIAALAISNRSVLIALPCIAAAGLYIFGLNRYLGPSSYDRIYKKGRYLSWMLAGDLVAFISLLAVKNAPWWAFILLLASQVAVFITMDASDKEDDRKYKAAKARATASTTAAPGTTAAFAEAMGLKYIDMRPQKEKDLQAKAQYALSGEDEEYAHMLVRIFVESKSLFSTDKAAYEKKRAEARAIGQVLCDNGGDDRMTMVAYRVQALGGSTRDCEYAWDGIGGWMA